MDRSLCGVEGARLKQDDRTDSETFDGLADRISQLEMTVRGFPLMGDAGCCRRECTASPAHVNAVSHGSAGWNALE
jgi:hypothetical protein